MEQTIPLLERLLHHFDEVEEAPFYPEEIQSQLTLLMQPKTFSDLAPLMNLNSLRRINDVIEKQYGQYMREYILYLRDLEKMPNVFSYSDDFI